MDGTQFYYNLYNRYNGTANDVDGVAGVQCADGFKIACRELGDPNWKRAIGGSGEYAGYAIWIYWNFYNNGYDKYFDLVDGDLPAQLGDILVYGFTDETPASHVSFYAGSDYPGTHYSWGQNQGAPDAGFNTILLSDYGVAAILRPKLEAPKPQPKPEPGPSGFFDVNESDWFYPGVKWAKDKGLVTGTGEQLFKPLKPISRADACVILWRFCGSPKVNQINPFKDVDSKAYYAPAVLWACSKGITNGSGQYFRPNEACKRAEAVTFLYRFCNAPDMGKTQIPYSDVAKNTYFYDAVRWSHAHQITDCGSKFFPYNPCSRGAFCLMLERTYKAANG